MTKQFSIYESPLSDETRKLRLNSLITTSLCLFIGLTGDLPQEFSVLGLKFSNNQQEIIGWFLVSVTTYTFLHFVSCGLIEVVNWIRPFYIYTIKKKKLLRHPAYDETDFMEMCGQINEYDLKQVQDEADRYAHLYVENKLGFVIFFVYLRIFIDVILPLIVGVTGIYFLVNTINNIK